MSFGGLSCLHLLSHFRSPGITDARHFSSFLLWVRSGCRQAPVEMLCLLRRLAGPIFIFSFGWGANAGFVSVWRFSLVFLSMLDWGQHRGP